jgi:hypothetical protein
VPTRFKVRVKKWVEPIQALMVPNGCSTVWRRTSKSGHRTGIGAARDADPRSAPASHNAEGADQSQTDGAEPQQGDGDGTGHTGAGTGHHAEIDA